MVRTLRILFMLVLLIGAAMLLWIADVNAGGAQITAGVDRDPVALNQSFILTFTAKGSVDGAPDFAPLRHDFQIISRAKSTNLEIINGAVNRSTQWKLNLMARHAGTITIPAIHFGSDSSQPIKVTVSAAAQTSSSNKDLFIDVDVSTKIPYVQAQVIYKMRLFRAVDLENATLSDLKVEGGNAIVEQLGEDKHYRTYRNGRQYSVIERDYAIFPQHSGRLTIDPLVLTGDVYRGVSSLWDPFGQSVRTERVQSKAVELQVKPIPAAFKGKLWLPAQSLQIHEAWSQQHPKFKVGDPVTRTVALIADGLTAGQLPNIHEHVPDSIKQYPDQPLQNDQKNPSGVVGVRQEKIALIPQRPGKVVLPAIAIPWWNVTTNKMEVARLPARTIDAAPAPGTAPAAAPPPAPAPAAQPKPQAPRTPAPVKPTTAHTHPWWPWLTGAFALAWLVTLLAWWQRSRHARRGGIRKRAAAPSARSLRNEVLSACDENGAAQAKDALLAWARRRWPQARPAGLGEVARLCGPPLGEAIRELNDALYGRSAGTWDGRHLKEALQALPESPAAARRDLDELEPLYKT